MEEKTERRRIDANAKRAGEPKRSGEVEALADRRRRVGAAVVGGGVGF